MIIREDREVTYYSCWQIKKILVCGSNALAFCDSADCESGVRIHSSTTTFPYIQRFGNGTSPSSFELTLLVCCSAARFRRRPWKLKWKPLQDLISLCLSLVARSSPQPVGPQQGSMWCSMLITRNEYSQDWQATQNSALGFSYHSPLFASSRGTSAKRFA